MLAEPKHHQSILVPFFGVILGVLLVSGLLVFAFQQLAQPVPASSPTSTTLPTSPTAAGLNPPAECAEKSATDADLSEVCTIWFTGVSVFGSATTSAPATYPKELASGTVLAGRWADADIIHLPDGTWRLYFGEEPETAGASLDIFTATSSDGLTWTLQEEPVITGGTFPDAVVLATGQIRLHYQSAQTIVSALSANGVIFRTESGTRIVSSLPEDMDSVRAPTTLRLSDGSFLMIYVGVKKGAPSTTAINQETDVFVAARSTDGLTYTKEGVILVGKQLPFDGFLDGPDLYTTSDGVFHLRFWTSGGRESISQAGQFEMTSNDSGTTWSIPTLFLSSAKIGDSGQGVLGGDPTYALKNSQLLMIFSRREEGLFYKIF
jgi:hypothetical protein